MLPYEELIGRMDGLVADIKTMKEAVKLLQSVYLEYGPYSAGTISVETWNKVRNFFKFDDSE